MVHGCTPSSRSVLDSTTRLVANWLVGLTTLRIFEEHNRAIGNVLRDGAELLVMAW